MKAFVRLMSSTAGRIGRVIAGTVLVAWGLVGIGGDTGSIVAAVGALPLLTGTLDLCLFGPLFGQPLRGCRVRAAAQ